GGQGDLQLAANTLAPYAAAAIGKRFGHGENKNEAAQAIGHFMLGAALAYANGADPLAGDSAAVAAERAAGYLAKQYDDGHTAIDPTTGKFNPNLLPEHIKEEIKAQTGAIASVVGAAGGSLNGTNGGNGALFDAPLPEGEYQDPFDFMRAYDLDFPYEYLQNWVDYYTGQTDT
ncbi:hypothetical protein ACTHUR_18245, partial [Neisseria sp. P0021.S007]